MTKEELFNYGVEIINKFCELNNIKKPKIVLTKGFRGGHCGEYCYDNHTIYVCLNKCATEVVNPGYGWSYHLI